MIEGLNDCIDTWCRKHSIDKSVLMEWKGKVFDKADEKIKTASKIDKSLLQQNNPLNTLNDINNQIVLTLIYKANGYVSFICQQFYAFVLKKELGLDHNNTGTNEIYIPVHKTNNHIITDCTTFLRNRFKLKVHDETFQHLLDP